MEQGWKASPNSSEGETLDLRRAGAGPGLQPRSQRLGAVGLRQSASPGRDGVGNPAGGLRVFGRREGVTLSSVRVARVKHLRFDRPARPKGKYTPI